MSDYSLLILIQCLFLFIFVLIMKMKHSKIPEFDFWLYRILEYNPTLSLEDAFNDYINKYDIIVLQEEGEPVLISQARTKMNLIKEYNIDEVLKEHERYPGYKMALERTLNN